KIGRFCAQNCGREIVSQRGLDGLHGLVCPGFDWDRLSPTLDSGFVGQSHDYRWPHRRLEEFKFAGQIVVEPTDFKANYPAHCSCSPPSVRALGWAPRSWAPRLCLSDMTQGQIFFIFIMRSKGCERKGGMMIASEFGDRSPAQQNGANDFPSFKLFARLVLMAFSPAVLHAAIPND